MLSSRRSRRSKKENRLTLSSDLSDAPKETLWFKCLLLVVQNNHLAKKRRDVLKANATALQMSDRKNDIDDAFLEAPWKDLLIPAGIRTAEKRKVDDIYLDSDRGRKLYLDDLKAGVTVEKARCMCVCVCVRT